MKPKNRIFCNGCGRSKVLFKTKDQADRFIAFNKESIMDNSNKVPSRSYYCEYCLGWHVTSIQSEYVGSIISHIERKEIDALDKNIQEKYKQSITEIEQSIIKRISKIQYKLYSGDFSYCTEQLELCDDILEELYIKSRFPFHYSELKNKISTLYNDMEKVKNIYDMEIEQIKQTDLLENGELSKYLLGIIYMKEFESLKISINDLICSKQFLMAQKLLSDFRNTKMRRVKKDPVNLLRDITSADFKVMEKKVKHGIIRQERKKKTQ